MDDLGRMGVFSGKDSDASGGVTARGVGVEDDPTNKWVAGSAFGSRVDLALEMCACMFSFLPPFVMFYTPDLGCKLRTK